jgi:hypothetical protein
MISKENEKNKSHAVVFKIIKDKKSSKSKRLIWCEEQDNKLKQIIKQYNGHQWNKISEDMRLLYPKLHITGKACRERWLTSIKDGLNRLPLTDSDNLTLIIMHHKYNNKWAAISSEMPGRNPSCLKNNFYSLVKKLVRQVKYLKDFNLVAPFNFFSTLYILTFIIDIFEPGNSEDYQLKSIPHIINYAKKLDISSKECKAHIEKMIQGFILSSKNLSVSALHGLKGLSWSNMRKFLEDVFEGLSQFVERYSADDAVSISIEKAIGNPPPPFICHLNSLLVDQKSVVILPPIFQSLTYAQSEYMRSKGLVNRSLPWMYCSNGA